MSIRSECLNIRMSVWCVCVCSFVFDSATPWTVVHQALLSMGFPRQEYWSGLPFPSSGDLPNPGIEPESSAWQVDSLPLSHPGSPDLNCMCVCSVSQSVVSDSLQTPGL